MKDRTEEIKALREFNIQQGYDADDASELLPAVAMLQRYRGLFYDLSAYHRNIMRILQPFGVIRFAQCEDGHQLEWEVKDIGPLHANRVYRIAPGYQLPDLSEETKPRYAEGTPVVDVTDGTVWIAATREDFRQERGERLGPVTNADWVPLRRFRVGYCPPITFLDKTLNDLQPLPPKPTPEDGWELTGKAVYCDGTQGKKLAEGEAWVTLTGMIGYHHDAVFEPYKKWRWVARRVEVVKESETKYCVLVDACRGKSLSPFRIPPNENGYEVKTLGAGMVSITPCSEE